MIRDVYYFPFLHREAAAATLPAGVRFFSCGLRDGKERSAGGDTPAGGGGDDLPLSPSEASAALEELLSLGNERFRTGGLRAAFFPDKAERAGREFAELERFVREGGTEPAPGGRDAKTLPETEREARIDCQKVLLLAHARERALLEAARLERELAGVESALRRSLGVDEEDIAALGGAPAEPSEAVPQMWRDVSWRAQAEAMLAFLPADAALCTAEPDIIEALRESGVMFSPVEIVNIPAGLDFFDGELYAAEVPGHVLAGRAGASASRPWLSRNVRVFCVPSGACSL